MTTNQTFVGLNELMGITEPSVKVDDGQQISVVEKEPFEAPVKFEEKNDEPIVEREEVDDFSFSRRIVHDMMEKGQELLDLAVKEARNVPHPRNIEVAAGVMKQMTKMSKELMDLHQARENVKSTRKFREQKVPETNPQGTTNIQDNRSTTIIVGEGTTSDLLAKVLEARKLADKDEEQREELRRIEREKNDGAIDAEFSDVPDNT